MGSFMLPIPGMAGYGNPTGIKGQNPVFEAETNNQLQALTTGPFNANVQPGEMTHPILAAALPTGNQAMGQINNVVSSIGDKISGIISPKTTATSAGSNNAGTFGYSMPSPEIANPTKNWDFKGIFDQVRRTMGYDQADMLTKALGQAWNEDVPKALLKTMEPLFQKNMANLLEQFGASGQRFGSTAALAAGDMTANFGAQQEQLLSGLYQNAYNTYLSTIMSVMSPKKSNGWGTLNNILGLVSTGAGALSAAGVGGTGAGASVLAGLSAL